MEPNAPTLALLGADFYLPAEAPTMTEAELVDWLARAVDQLMQDRPDYLRSLCYTLDIDEAAVAAALHPAAPEPPNRGLARLLYARQWRRARSKQTIPAPPLDDEDAW